MLRATTTVPTAVETDVSCGVNSFLSAAGISESMKVLRTEKPLYSQEIQGEPDCLQALPMLGLHDEG